MLRAQNHWGKWITSDVPVTGVISPYSLECVYNENEIHPEYDLLQTDPDYHDPECDIVTGADLEGTDLECTCSAGEYFEPTYSLIGDWVIGEGDLYSPAPDGEYSAIFNYNENTIQVIASTTIARRALCSPCYPGQCDLDTRGDWLCFDVPGDLYGDRRDPELPYTVQIATARVAGVSLTRGDTLEIVPVSGILADPGATRFDLYVTRYSAILPDTDRMWIDTVTRIGARSVLTAIGVTAHGKLAPVEYWRADRDLTVDLSGERVHILAGTHLYRMAYTAPDGAPITRITLTRYAGTQILYRTAHDIAPDVTIGDLVGDLSIA